MYLVDTSVWIDYLQGRSGRHVEFLDGLLDNPLAAGISVGVYMEILQGARDQNAFDRLRRYFSLQRFYLFSDTRQAHEAAAQIYALRGENCPVGLPPAGALPRCKLLA
ncbi:MAG: PIN domain-containing protein [Sulfuricellaceae bacterium]